MIHVAQFGTGNFLRAFADLYFQRLTEEGKEFRVHLVQSTSASSLVFFRRQGNRYHVVLQGVEEGRLVQEVHPISVLEEVFSVREDLEAFWALACHPDLALVISNTTEAGICYRDSDRLEDLASASYPGKLTAFLYKRFQAGLGGLTILPLELIEENAKTLADCVEQYITLWHLPETFRTFHRTQNFYCGTLVDRIVSGYPKDPLALRTLEELVGESDALLTVAEPYGLWVVEEKGNVASLLPSGRHGLELILTKDVDVYRRRKVRILNGSHTNLVGAGLLFGCKTVYDCMTHPKLYAFFQDALAEIVPTVSADLRETKAYAAAVEDRFRNETLRHALRSISLNSMAKWRARILPTICDYRKREGRLPRCLMKGFAYLLHYYRTQTDQVQDEESVLAWFQNSLPLQDFLPAFLRDLSLWGEDLTIIPGFLESVQTDLAALERGEALL